MNGIDKYMIPLDNIQSTHAYDIMLAILLTLFIGLGTALFADEVASIFLGHADLAVAVTVGTIMTVLTCCWTFQGGYIKSIDTPKINDEYGITVTSMGAAVDEQGGIESHRLSYLHDGAMINGTLIVKDNAASLFAGTGDKRTPVKPRSVDNASASPTTTNTTEPSKPRQTTRSRTGCYVKSYNEDGSIKELAGDCPAAPTH